MRETMWESIGVEASVNDFDVAMREADLDYNVVAKDLEFKSSTGESVVLPDKKLLVREDTDEVFGIVSDRYKICQNKEALDFVRYIDDIELVKAGSYNGLVYLIAKLPEVTILGDTISPHLIFQNSHDGSSSIRSTICMLRLICQNQFITSFKNSPATVKVSHIGDMDGKLIVARDTLKQVNEYIRSFDQEANDLAKVKLTPIRFNKVLEKFFATSEEYSDKQNERILQDKERFLTAFNTDDNQNFIKTKWGLVNAYSDYLTHYEPIRKTDNWKDTRFIYGISPTPMDNFINFVKAV